MTTDENFSIPGTARRYREQFRQPISIAYSLEPLPEERQDPVSMPMEVIPTASASAIAQAQPSCTSPQPHRTNVIFIPTSYFLLPISYNPHLPLHSLSPLLTITAMIAPKSIAFLFVSILLFAGATYLGYWYHGTLSVKQVLAQPGWCCVPGKFSCGVSVGRNECNAGGGVVFNWDQSSCDALCLSVSMPRSSAPATQ